MQLLSSPSAVERRTCRFGPLTIAYDDRVLTPRPWTLQQSRWAADLAANGRPGPILELCAGAGHIGLAASVMADRDLVQVEADPVAAAHAVANATAADRAGRVEVRLQPMDSALRPGETWPIIIADPPYLPSATIDRFPEDPPTAIDGGSDGLRLIRTCLALADRHLASGGWLLLQVAGPAQAEQVSALLGRPGGPALQRHAVRTVDDERAILLLARA